MRVSTGMIYEAGLGSMQRRTSSLLRSQQQLAEGRRILRPSDDPVAAARALEVTQSKDANANQAAARDNAKNTLSLAESHLQSAGDLMARVRELAVQAGNASLSAQDRRSIANELRVRFDEMVALANSRDGTGLYLFGGYQTGNQPFAGSVEHGVVYGGDDGARTLRVSGSRELPVSDSGNDLFMRIKNGNGVFATSTQYEKPANATRVTYEGADNVTNPPATTGSYELRFWTDTAGTVQTSAQAVGAVDLNSVVPVTFNTGVDNPISITIDGGPPIVFDLDTSGTGTTYNTASAIVTALQGAVGAAATVSLDTNGQLVITNTSTGAPTSTLALADGGGVGTDVFAALFGAPAIVNGANGAAGTTYADLVDPTTGLSLYTNTASTTGGAGNTYTHAYQSGTPFDLASAGPFAFDLGAEVVLTGTPADGDTFTIDRTPLALTVTGTTFSTSAARATIDAGAVTDPVKWNQAANSGNLEVRFWVDAAGDIGAAGTTYYDLVDADTGDSLFTGNPSASGAGGSYTHAYTSGAPIPLSSLAPVAFDFGASVTISGIPAGGDAFTIKADDGYLSNGYFATAAKTATTPNTGSGIIGVGELRDPAKWGHPANSRNLEVRFWKDAAGTAYYDLVDAETEKSLFSNTTSTAGGAANTYTHAFVAGDPIVFDGLNIPYAGPPATTVTDFGFSVVINGTPGSGDRFKVEASASESVFDTMGRLITSLETGAPPGTTGNTHLSNELSVVLAGISQIEDNFLRGRAVIGSRMAEIDDLDTVGENLDLKYAETLSSLQDLDYAEAITRLTRQQTELQAAQQSFARISQLSLFDYLR